MPKVSNSNNNTITSNDKRPLTPKKSMISSNSSKTITPKKKNNHDEVDSNDENDRSKEQIASSPVPSRSKKLPVVTPDKSESAKEKSPKKVSGRRIINDDDTTIQVHQGVKASSLEINPRVDKIYKLIRKQTGTLGGNGTTGAIYGELTMHSMQRCINILIDKCEMTSQSRFIDVGSGLGKPNFHASQYPGVRLSIGVELEQIRWQLAMTNFDKILPHMDDNLVSSRSNSNPETNNNDNDDNDIRLYGGVNFIVGDIDNFSSTDPFTHIYMYDLGFPPPLQQRIADKFNNSVHARYLVSYRPPHRVINEYGYKVEIVDQVNTSMHGSGESHMAYFYKRINTPAQPSSSSFKIKIPRRRNFPNEKDEEVVCAEEFAESVKLAVNGITNLTKYVNDVCQQHLTAERPKRERKPRIYTDV